MKKILVTTDFSNNSTAGIQFAIQLASQTPCTLIFYHVDDRSDIDVWTDNLYNQAESTRNADQQMQLRKFVAAVYAQTDQQPGETDWIVDNKPLVDRSIIGYAKKRNVDFICMSTRGGGVLDKYIGTNAERLITTSPVPIFIVPRGYQSKPIDLLLYASDLENLESELKLVKDFAEAVTASVSVCHYGSGEDAQVKNRLETLYGSDVNTKVSIRFQKFYAEHSLIYHLKQDLKRLHPSLLIMFTKQDRNWYEKLFLPSKTAEMGFDTQTPLLVFRK